MASGMLYVMLIKASENVLNNRQLVNWIAAIEDDYMERFGDIGASLAHVRLNDAPWQFALVFPGTEESAQYLASAITAQAPGETDILTMNGIDLDEFRGLQQQGA